MTSLKETLNNSSDLEGLIEQEFERLFAWQASHPVEYYSAIAELSTKIGTNSEERKGLHGSSIIAAQKDFCYREQVISLYFKGKFVPIGNRLRRIFLEGWLIHLKWQALFQGKGIALGIEDRRMNPEYELYFTPDAIITLFNRKWVVEIKSMNTYGFQSLKKAPEGAIKQVSLYMNELSVLDGEEYEQGIVLVEDKNSQNFKLWVVENDKELVAPFIKRMENIQHAREVLASTAPRLPKRICQSADDKRAKACPMVEQCFRKSSELISEFQTVHGEEDGA